MDSNNTSAVVVVPMPRLSCSASVRSKMAAFAERIERAMRSFASSTSSPLNEPRSLAISFTAISLAISPAAWPPMPSATTKTPRSGTMR